eukprot:1340874-Amorphochlora_amoeboformis.AAC.2
MYFRSKRSSKTTRKPAPAETKAEKKGLSVESFVKKRDYTGAYTLLEFERQTKKKNDSKTLGLLSYCYFHNCDYQKAVDIYDILLKESNCDPSHYLHKAAAQFYLGMFKEAMDTAQKGPKTRLRNRIMLHCAHKTGDKQGLMKYWQEISEESTEDQLCIASLQYMKSNYQEATEIYKKVLLSNREEYLALQ